MRLRLKIEGVDFQLKIGYWKPHNPKISYDDEWCRVELYMSSYYLNTHNDGELLECGEVTWLKDQLTALLDGTLKEDKTLSSVLICRYPEYQHRQSGFCRRASLPHHIF